MPLLLIGTVLLKPLHPGYSLHSSYSLHLILQGTPNNSASPRYSLDFCYSQIFPPPLLLSGNSYTSASHSEPYISATRYSLYTSATHNAPYTYATHNAPYTYAIHRHFLPICHFQVLPTPPLSQVFWLLTGTSVIFAPRYSLCLLPLSSCSLRHWKLKYSRNP